LKTSLNEPPVEKYQKLTSWYSKMARISNAKKASKEAQISKTMLGFQQIWIEPQRPNAVSRAKGALLEHHHFISLLPNETRFMIFER
jgi:hypothetical protein